MFSTFLTPEQIKILIKDHDFFNSDFDKEYNDYDFQCKNCNIKIKITGNKFFLAYDKLDNLSYSRIFDILYNVEFKSGCKYLTLSCKDYLIKNIIE